MYPNSIICIINSFWLCLFLNWASLVAQTVENPPAMKETWDQSLGWKDPLEKGMETHSSILAWRIPWTEEPGRLQSIGWQRVRHDWSDLAYSHTPEVCCDVILFLQRVSKVRTKERDRWVCAYSCNKIYPGFLLSFRSQFCWYNMDKNVKWSVFTE